MIIFRHSGLKCMVTESRMGFPLGYVGLSKSHADFGKHYDEVDDLDIHGGLTFSDYRKDLDDNLWYLGFDCGHAMDIDMLAGYSHFKSNKSMEYAEKETKRLAEQLAKRDK